MTLENLNLNTSHVKVNRDTGIVETDIDVYLNTSHVKVNLVQTPPYLSQYADLNTSHVKVNHTFDANL